MTWRTHALLGVGSLWLLQPVPHGIGTGDGVSNVGLLAAAAAFGALLPDLDASESRIKHLSPGWGIEPFALPSLLLHRAFGHRGLLHPRRLRFFLLPPKLRLVTGSPAEDALLPLLADPVLLLLFLHLRNLAG